MTHCSRCGVDARAVPTGCGDASCCGVEYVSECACTDADLCDGDEQCCLGRREPVTLLPLQTLGRNA